MMSDFWSDAFNWLTTDEDEEGEEIESSESESYLSLWRRMNLVVKVLAKQKDKENATKCVLDFFKKFEDLEELEATVVRAEDLITRPDDSSSDS